MPENNPPSGTREAVTEAVRNAMAKHKMSGRAVADGIGMPQSNFSRRLTDGKDGGVDFTIEELARVAAFLGEPLAEMLAGIDMAAAQ
jgi:predicted XRE-type DNA-binding protein